MTQITVSTAVEAFKWIDQNAHHIVGTEWHPTKRDEKGRQVRTHIFLKNYHDTLRIPERVVSEVFAGIRPNKRAFDTRMYALTRKTRQELMK